MMTNLHPELHRMTATVKVAQDAAAHRAFGPCRPSE
jgi:hypothetical protein